ncbi:MAG: penicillin-binding protein 1A [Succinivibrionaceae bacterium]|nr:penicillin-binding protein 1A [Succinivibrionaceae bacterium]
MFTFIRRTIWFFLLCISLAVAAGCVFFLKMESELPDINELKNVEFETPMHIYSSDGKLMFVFGQIKREPIAIQDVPKMLINAFVSIEDQRFYEHSGFDMVGIIRAAVEYAKTHQKKQGASTITQQVAKNFFLTRERTFERKIKELIISLKIERELTKDQIMELYLNKIALGHNSYGVVAASKVYFGKELGELTLAEMATLAGLPKAPSSYNPISHPEKSKERRNLVLSKMLQYGYISREEYNQAVDEPLISSYHGPEIEFRSDYIAEMARQRVIDRFGEAVTTKGIKVYTTVNSEVQKLADDAVFKGIMEYDRRHGYRGAAKTLWNPKEEPWDEEKIQEHLKSLPKISSLIPAVATRVTDREIEISMKNNMRGVVTWEGIKWAARFLTDRRVTGLPRSAKEVAKAGQLIYVYTDDKGVLQLGQIPAVQSALVSLDPQNGAIRAMVGGFSFAQSKFNRAEQAKRQPGSNIKPFIYSAAIEHGYTPSSIIMDVPIGSWESGKSHKWHPKNSPNVYDGPITMREALAKSKNVVAVRLLRGTGLKNVVAHLEKLGFSVPKMYQNDPLALGTLEMTPLELARGYAAISNGGFLIHPYIVQRIEDDSGNLLYEANPVIACTTCEDHVMDPQAYSDGHGHRIARQVISHANAFLISDMMHTGIYGGADRGLGGFNGTGWRTAKAMPNRKDFSGKTGTTNNSKDCWFTGLNGDVVTSVWIGFDNHARSLGREAGATAAQPIWNYFMVPYMKNFPENPVYKPDTVITHKVSRATGLFVGDGAAGRNEFFEIGTNPADHSAFTGGASNSYFNYGSGKSSGSESSGNTVPTASDLF